MTNYSKGAQFEYRVRDFFRDRGYVAERKAGSAPYDLIVFKDGKVVFLIDAKKTSQKKRDYIYVGKEDLEKIVKEASKLGTVPLIVWGFDRTPIYCENAQVLLEKTENKNIRLEVGRELESLLEPRLLGS